MQQQCLALLVKLQAYLSLLLTAAAVCSILCLLLNVCDRVHSVICVTFSQLIR